MPELPEVETVRRGMEESLAGKVVKSVRVQRHDLRVAVPANLNEIMEGQEIIALQRRGKYIIWHLSSPQALILHLGMSGRIHIYPPAAPYTLEKHDHVLIEMVDGTHIIFNDPRRFGMLYATSAQSWARQKPFCAMGPEPLEHWCEADLLCALERRKIPIKNALLDQGVVSGLGNIYVCEALYRAKISPLRPASAINNAQARTLVHAIKAVLESAIAAGGSTLKDYQHTDGSLGYFQYGFDVYDREGEKCLNPSCGKKIKRVIQSGRSTFYCPACQK